MELQKLSKSAIKTFSALHSKEYAAHYFYRYVAQCLKSEGFEIAANYFFAEAEDELKHAKIISDYVNQWNGEVDFMPIAEPIDTEGLVDIIYAAYAMEFELLNSYKYAGTEMFENGDLEHFGFIQQFIEIQNKAVGEYSDKINMLALFNKEDKNWLFQFEKKLFKK